MIAVFPFLRLTLGLLFLAAGLSKAWDRRAFRLAVEGFKMVSSRFAPSVAAVIVIVELIGGALLLAGVYEWVGAALLAGLLAAFNFALIVNLRRGRRNLDCRCFGAPTVRIGWGHVFQNTLLFAMTLLTGVIAWRDHPATGFNDPATAAVTMLASVYAVVFFLISQELVTIRSGMRRLSSRIQTE